MMVEIVSKGSEISALRESLGAKVSVCGEPAYESLRRGWNLAVEQSPRVIVDAETAEDVRDAVRFAQANAMPVAVMTTGHGTPRACEGLLIRMSRMNAVNVDPRTRIARIAGGALVGDVQSAATMHGLTMLLGSSSGVGAVGYTLGGGYGLFVRKHGLAVDRILTLQIVTPAGELVTASPTKNSDLFWAVRGGGGAFGVVVEMEMELLPQTVVYGGATIYPADDAQVESILRDWAAWTEDLPEEVSSTAILMNLPPLPSIPEPLRGRTVVTVNACVCGAIENAEALVEPMRRLGTPILDLWGALPVAESDRIFNDPKDPMPGLIRGATLRNLEPETIGRLLEAVGPIAQMPQIAVQFRHIGGVMARTEAGNSPLGPCRRAGYLMYTIGVPNPFASAAALHDHTEGLIEALGESLVTRGPLNFIGEGNACGRSVRGVYGEEEHAKLREIKRAVDPTNAFRYASVGLD